MAEEGSLVTDVAIAGVIVGAIVGGLFLYAGVWPPLVVVESGSMMHDDASFGKFGTIDPGDLVVVTSVQGPGDVTTFIEGCTQAKGSSQPCRNITILSGCPGGRGSYGNCGDVIVYDAGRGTPVIHRAMAYVQVHRSGGELRYTVEGYGIDNASEVVIPSLGITESRALQPRQSGFLTKGDANAFADQTSGGRLPSEPISLDGQIIGTARGELPWFGLIKLAVAGNAPSCVQHQDWPQVLRACAPGDLWVMLGFSVAFILFLPNMVAPIYEYAAPRVRERARAWKERDQRDGPSGQRTDARPREEE